MNQLRILALIATASILVGCGPTDGKFLLEGTATWNGAPIESGDLELQPADGRGQIDGGPIVNGKFTIRTSAGPKKISVFARRQIGMTEPTERIPNPEPILFQYLPPRFNDRTELERTVNVGEPLALELTGEELTPAGAASPADRARETAQGGTARE